MQHDDDEHDATPLPRSWEDADTHELARVLMLWHGGQGDPVYAVGSSWYAGQRVPAYIVEGALRNLRGDLRKRGSKRDKDTKELREAVAELERLTAKPKVQTMTGSKATKLPALFQNLSARDWASVRAAAAQLGAGDEEAVALSVGYVDVGKLDGGLAYVGGMSFDAQGGGGLSYRKVMQPHWGR